MKSKTSKTDVYCSCLVSLDSIREELHDNWSDKEWTNYIIDLIRSEVSDSTNLSKISNVARNLIIGIKEEPKKSEEYIKKKWKLKK